MQTFKLRNTFFFFLFSILVSSTAQDHLFDHYQAVYFNTGEKELADVQQAVLDTFLTKFTNQKELYLFKVSGFTDHRGSEEENLTLSINRAETVKRHLITKGFEAENISTTGKGIASSYLKYYDKNTLAENRRVEIRVRLKIQPPKQIGDYALHTQSTEYKVESGTTFIYNSGTKVTIPKNCFIDANNNLVKGIVKIEYVEYRNKIDFILSGIPMSLETEHGMENFNSAGMFKIKASQNGKEVAVAPGKEIEIAFKTTRNQTNWDIYSFNENAHLWNNENQKPSGKVAQTSIDKTRAVSTCGGSDCEKLIYLIQQGERYTQFIINEAEHYRYLVKGDSLNNIDRKQQMIDMKKQQIFYALQPKYKVTEYLENNIKRKEGHAYFTIDNLLENANDMLPMKDVVWETSEEYNSKVIFANQFDRLWISYNKEEKNYKISLGDNFNQKVSVNPVYNLLGKKKADQKAAFQKILAERETLADDFKKERKKYEVSRFRLRHVSRKEDSIRTTVFTKSGNVPFADAKWKMQNLECFWVLNQPYMTSKEKQMDMLTWYEFLHKNWNRLGPRYAKIKKT